MFFEHLDEGRPPDDAADFFPGTLLQHTRETKSVKTGEVKGKWFNFVLFIFLSTFF